MTSWGYARVSTAGQDAALQRDALLAAGVNEAHLIEETASGARASRPGLDRLLGQLEAGDELVVWKLDRLGRSLSHLVGLLDELGTRGVAFRSLTEGLDTNTASGRLLAHVVGAMAQFERDLISERTRAGLEAARASGRQLGRRPVAAPVQVAAVHKMVAAGVSQRQIAASVGLSRSAVGRIARGEVLALSDDEHTLAGVVNELDLYPESNTQTF